MSKEKQIEEMADVLARAKVNACATIGSMNSSFGMWYATALYTEGYRKQIEAEWITDEEGYVTCSNCGEEHTWDEFRPPYCDMCGARMKGGAE